MALPQGPFAGQFNSAYQTDYGSQRPPPQLQLNNLPIHPTTFSYIQEPRSIHHHGNIVDSRRPGDVVCKNFRKGANCFFVIVLIFSILLLVLHFTGVTARSYHRSYMGNATTLYQSPLDCYCKNLKDCENFDSQPYSRCLQGSVCAISVDRHNFVTKGCIKDRHYECEYLDLNDYAVYKPRFDPGGSSSRVVKRSASARSTSSEQRQYYHVCYCRTKLCNTGDLCLCER